MSHEVEKKLEQLLLHYFTGPPQDEIILFPFISGTAWSHVEAVMASRCHIVYPIYLF